jgi:hypothetical protein
MSVKWNRGDGRLCFDCVRLRWPGWAVGLFFGLLLSVPDAIITKAYAPIFILGAVGGLLICGFIQGWKLSDEGRSSQGGVSTQG